jgi:hypothetical protein
MTTLTWDETGQRFYETGVDHGVLYIPDSNGAYTNGVAWNGLTTVTESPSGAESNPLYADNIKYLNLISTEEFGATIEAYTYPDEFAQFDGTAVPTPGVSVGQQARKAFGLSYRTRLGNDIDGDEYGYKIHIIYNATAAPSEKAYATVNDSPEAITFSWELTTIPVPLPGARPTATLTIDSTKVNAADLAELEDLLYGTVGQDPSLPAPDVVIGLFMGAQTSVMAQNPSFVASTGVITVPTVTGVRYFRADTNATVTGTVTIGTAGATLVIKAEPSNSDYVLAPESDNSWSFTRNP